MFDVGVYITFLADSQEELKEVEKKKKHFGTTINLF